MQGVAHQLLEVVEVAVEVSGEAEEVLVALEEVGPTLQPLTLASSSHPALLLLELATAWQC
jgi:hypothetical protein